MAREVAAILRKPLRDPVDLSLLPAGDAGDRCQIENFDLCPRYSALVFENVTVQPSPLWLQYRLEAIGLNPINNIVDVTNYVMAEIAQPMHAFDADKLQGRIRVRSRQPRAKRWPRSTARRMTLNPSNLVIADDSGADCARRVSSADATARSARPRSALCWRAHTSMPAVFARHRRR